MDTNKVRDEVTKLVEDILAKKAEAGLQADVEEALSAAEKSVSDMTDRVAEVEARAATDASTIEALEGSKSELETELAAKKGELVSLQTEKDVLLKRVETAETVLETMEKDKFLSDRMAELDESKISRAGDSRDAQAQFVREMSDEEFAVYKDDMVALREELVASVKAEFSVSVNTDGSNNNSEGNAKADEEGEGSVLTPPANVANALETASVIMPNVETSDISAGWEKFGSCLSNYIRDQRGDASEGKR